ncbi:MAG TPA: GntG family PLP-dependent aldolase [Propioniciclava tarda]|nr:GntG family PLP-dependent aldolase [Propioniciclava tarda]HQA29801.1 GntG family PLP-dependent aldolase [Propioniciclava tarda]HQD59782.1 GntG family PLP-dependent aldolase [Propioniciclava tarda]
MSVASVIDLRSDTLTQPSAGMRAAMTSASVGDDVYDEDPTVHELEARVAALLGHEAGLFTATGSLANQLGVALHVGPGEEVLCDARAHIARAEMGAHGALHGVTMRTWVTNDGVADAAQITNLLEPDAGPYLVSTRCVALENTHNFGGGTIQPLPGLQRVTRICHDLGVKVHLDGARLWNAHVATGVPLDTYGRLFDTVSVCLSKGLGAPVGSVLVGTASEIARARVLRKRLGAGWRQAGLLAAAGLYALEHNIGRLADDHAAAQAFAEAVEARAPHAVKYPETNIVVASTESTKPAAVVEAAAARGVRISALGPKMIRAVTHLDVSVEDCARAGAIVGDLLAN